MNGRREQVSCVELGYKNQQRRLKRQQTQLSIPLAKMCNQEKKMKQQQQQQQKLSVNKSPNSSPPSPTAAYALYLHREELRRHKAQSARASITKIHLTSELIAKTKENIGKCSQEDLQILARETIFKKRMQRHLHYRRQQLQAWLLARKQRNIGKQMQ